MSLPQQNTLKDAMRNAMAQGYFAAIIKAIEQYPEAANFKLSNSINENVLQSAIRKRRPEAAQIATYATPESLMHNDQNGCNALALAITHDQLTTVKAILKQAKAHHGKSFLEKIQPLNSNLLTLAAENQQPQSFFIFKTLLDAGIDPNTIYPSEHTARILFAPNCMELMAEKGWTSHGQHPKSKATWAAYLNTSVPQDIRLKIISATTEDEWRSMAVHMENAIQMTAIMHVLTQAQGQVAKEIMEVAGPMVGAEQPNFHGNLALHYAIKFAPQICRSVSKDLKNTEKAMQWYGDFVLKPISHYTGGSQILKFGKTLNQFAENADNELTYFFTLLNKTPSSILSTAILHGEKLGKMDKLFSMAQELTPTIKPKQARTKI